MQELGKCKNFTSYNTLSESSYSSCKFLQQFIPIVNMCTDELIPSRTIARLHTFALDIGAIDGLIALETDALVARCQCHAGRSRLVAVVGASRVAFIIFSA